MLTWLHALPADVVSANPVLSTAVGWSAMVAGDLGGLERHLDDADALLAAAAADPIVATAWEQTDDLETAPPPPERSPRRTACLRRARPSYMTRMFRAGQFLVRRHRREGRWCPR
jgi:hypothetical protein